MRTRIQVDPENIFFRCVEDSDEAIMISDRDGILVYVNPAWCRIYGYSREEAVGASPKLLHSGQQDPEFYKEMWASIRDGSKGSWKGELTNRAKDGSLVPVLLAITPYRVGEGVIDGYMGIAVDLRFKRELEAKVAHQDRLASIGLLASGLAHEIGTPLGVVRGRAELLMMQTESPEFRKNLEVITSQIDRISKLIRSLLRVSRSFSDVQITDVNVQEVVTEVFSLIGQNLNEDSVKLVLRIPEGLLVKADFGRLEQILLNLVMNSIHAIRKAIQGGRVSGHSLTLSVEREASGRVAIQLIDTGCGISTANMNKLFRPFFTTKDVGEGTGLGLAIVAQLAHEMEGKIMATSVLGQGATFTLVLPACVSN